MNINAVNSLMMNKNLKFKALNAEQTAAPSLEAPVSNPEESMKMLQMQAQNNVAFQGLNVAKAKKLGLALTAVMAAGLFTSCEPKITEIPDDKEYDHITNVTVTVNVDMSALTSFLERMEQRDKAMFDLIKQWMTEWQQGQITNNEYYEKMYELMLGNNENQKHIIDMLVEGGKTKEEAINLLAQILAEVEAGNLTQAEAYSKILEALGQINAKLDAIIDKLGDISEGVTISNQMHEKYWLSALEKMDKFSGDIVDLKVAQNLSNIYLKQFVENTDSLGANLGQFEGSYGNITIKDLEELLKANREAYQLFIEAQIGMNLDTIQKDVATIKDYTILIDSKMNRLEAYAQQRDSIVALLSKIDWSVAQDLGVDKEIRDLIAQFKHNCGCGKDANEHEGILGDLANAVGKLED